MRKVIAVLVLVILFIPSVSLAFFDPTRLLDLAITASMQESAEAPSPAFVSLTTVYNELFSEKRLTSGMVKDLWTALKEPELIYIEDMLDTLGEICSARNITEAEGLKIGIVKNTRKTHSFNIKMCTAEELKDEIAQGKIAYVHVAKDSARETGTEELIKTINPLFNIRQYYLVNDTASNQADIAFVITGMKDSKALVSNNEGEVEIDFGKIVNTADYIVAFDSPKLQTQKQEKSETEDYFEKIKREVKK